MEIERVTVHQFEVPLAEPFVTVLRPIPELKRLLVEVETDTGLTGLGEAAPSYTVTGETQRSTKAVILDVLADLVIGADPRNVDRLVEEMRALVVGSPSAHAGIETALHDIRGKAADMPLYQLLGGHSREPTVDVPKILSVKDPEDMADEAEEAVADGYEQVKIKVGKDPETDRERVGAIADRVPASVSLKADANQGWGDAKTALEALSGMTEHLDVIEQPVSKDSVEDLGFVRDRVDIPVMADECVRTAADASRLIRAGAADYYNVKLMKTGGISEAARLSTVAAAAGRKTQLGSMVEGHVGTAAGVHFALATENVVWNEMVGPFMTTDGITDLDVDEPHISVSGPGLGVSVDREALARLRSDRVVVE